MAQSPINESPHLLTNISLIASLLLSNSSAPAGVASRSLSLSLTLSHSHPHSIPKLTGHSEAPVTRFLQTARRILGKCISKRITRCARTPQLHTQASPALPLSLHENSAPSPAIPRHHSLVLLQSSTSLLLATHILPNSTHENSKKNRYHRNP